MLFWTLTRLYINQWPSYWWWYVICIVKFKFFVQVFNLLYILVKCLIVFCCHLYNFVFTLRKLTVKYTCTLSIGIHFSFVQHKKIGEFYYIWFNSISIGVVQNISCSIVCTHFHQKLWTIEWGLFIELYIVWA